MSNRDSTADPEARTSAEDDEDEAATQSGATVPPFSERRLRWQIIRDRTLRWGLAIGVLVMLVVVTAEPYRTGTPFGFSYLAVILAVVLAVGAWMLVNGISARSSTQLPRLTAMIEEEPEQAEARLAWHFSRKPLVKWVRLLLYHRLALLRHHQQRYDETAAICHALLQHHLGPAKRTRRHLLLMLAEAQLERGDALGAFGPIEALHHAPLSLIESLQRLALQTRYELLAGFPQYALWQEPRKRRLAELLPAPHCGALHAMLATAADRCEQRELGDWLWQRTQLLSTQDQLNQFREGRFSVSLVKSPEAVGDDAAGMQQELA